MSVTLRVHFSSANHSFVLVSVQRAIKLTAEKTVSAYQRGNREGNGLSSIVCSSVVGCSSLGGDEGVSLVSTGGMTSLLVSGISSVMVVQVRYCMRFSFKMLSKIKKFELCVLTAAGTEVKWTCDAAVPRGTAAKKLPGECSGHRAHSGQGLHCREKKLRSEVMYAG